MVARRPNRHEPRRSASVIKGLHGARSGTRRVERRPERARGHIGILIYRRTTGLAEFVDLADVCRRVHQFEEVSVHNRGLDIDHRGH